MVSDYLFKHIEDDINYIREKIDNATTLEDRERLERIFILLRNAEAERRIAEGAKLAYVSGL